MRASTVIAILCLAAEVALSVALPLPAESFRFVNVDPLHVNIVNPRGKGRGSKKQPLFTSNPLPPPGQRPVAGGPPEHPSSPPKRPRKKPIPEGSPFTNTPLRGGPQQSLEPLGGPSQQHPHNFMPSPSDPSGSSHPGSFSSPSGSSLQQQPGQPPSSSTTRRKNSHSRPAPYPPTQGIRPEVPIGQPSGMHQPPPGSLRLPSQSGSSSSQPGQQPLSGTRYPQPQAIGSAIGPFSGTPHQSLPGQPDRLPPQSPTRPSQERPQRPWEWSEPTPGKPYAGHERDGQMRDAPMGAKRGVWSEATCERF